LLKTSTHGVLGEWKSILQGEESEAAGFGAKHPGKEWPHVEFVGIDFLKGEHTYGVGRFKESK